MLLDNIVSSSETSQQFYPTMDRQIKNFSQVTNILSNQAQILRVVPV